MPRTSSITYDQVAKAAQTLVDQGTKPTIEKIRTLLGSGSPPTISKHLKAWKNATIAFKEATSEPISTKEDIKDVQIELPPLSADEKAALLIIAKMEEELNDETSKKVLALQDFEQTKKQLNTMLESSNNEIRLLKLKANQESMVLNKELSRLKRAQKIALKKLRAQWAEQINL